MASTKSWYVLAICLSTLDSMGAEDIQPGGLLNTVRLQGDNFTLRIIPAERFEGYGGYGGWKRCVPTSCYSIDHCTEIDYVGNSSKYHRSVQNVSHKYTSYELTIVDALLEDAGMYTFITDFVDRRFSTEVIILESDPICSRNTSYGDVVLEGDVIVMSCQVKYQGIWAPIMVWQENGFNVNGTKNETVEGARDVMGLAKYTVVAVATRTMNGTVYSVETSFRPTGIHDWKWDTDPTFFDKYLYIYVNFHAYNKPGYMYVNRFRPLHVNVRPPDNTTEECLGDQNADGKHDDADVLVAALVPTVPLVICTIALGISLWKHRRLRDNQRRQSSGFATNVEMAPAYYIRTEG